MASTLPIHGSSTDPASHPITTTRDGSQRVGQWKRRPKQPRDDTRIPLLSAQKYFAVDASGSTAGAIMIKQKEFVFAAYNPQKNDSDSASLWGSVMTDPERGSTITKMRWRSNQGGTYPSRILQREPALDAILESAVWFLLTDGEIDNYEVSELGRLAQEKGVLNVPVVFVITGARGKTPESANISVGISLFASAQDAVIMFKETSSGKLWTISAKGCFAGLRNHESDDDNLTGWDKLPMYENDQEFFEQCQELNIQVRPAASRLTQPRGVSLGPEWERIHGGPMFVDLDILLKTGQLPDDEIMNLLAEEAFNTLSIACKTRSRIAELREFVRVQKIAMLAPKLEDVSGATAILQEMAKPDISETGRKDLQQKLREAHAANRQHYQTMVANFADSPQEQALRKRNQLVDAALRTLATIESAGYTADILSRKSNRARRAEAVSGRQVDIEALDLDGDAFKGFCLVCCGENEVMSISLKWMDHERASENTTDFALNYPLAAGVKELNLGAVSSQNICFQCAVHGWDRRSIYQEDLSAIIPTFSYDGGNKAYIHEQLYVALTASLKTGAAGVAQLFMAILDQTLKTKAWAGAQLESSGEDTNGQEIIQRKKTFEYMLNQFMANTRTRETFSETGEWVDYPQALQWILKDFKENDLASFPITYPVAGYMVLISLGRRLGLYTDAQVRRMNVSKIIYSVTSAYLANLLEKGRHDLSWQQQYLELLYEEFNAELVPRDVGGVESIVAPTSSKFWTHLGTILPHDLFGPLDEKTKVNLVPKIQILLFWLLYHQGHHVTARNFFKHCYLNYNLAKAVLDPTLPISLPEVHSKLRSIFVSRQKLLKPEIASLHGGPAAFTTPFGPSVISCGYVRCQKSFLPADFDSKKGKGGKDVERVRQARRLHFIDAFGIRGRFERNQTGLPEVTETPRSPSSEHVNLHIEIVRVWSELSRETRQAVVRGDEKEYEEFVETVVKKIGRSKRGNIYDGEMGNYVRRVLPSFFEALRIALRVEGREESDVSIYEHDFNRNTFEDKVEYELALGEMGKRVM